MGYTVWKRCDRTMWDSIPTWALTCRYVTIGHETLLWVAKTSYIVVTLKLAKPLLTLEKVVQHITL